MVDVDCDISTDYIKAIKSWLKHDIALCYIESGSTIVPTQVDKNAR